MKTNIFLFSAICSFVLAACTQAPPAEKAPDYNAIVKQQQRELYEKAYHEARQMDDSRSALSYAYALMALDTNQQPWYDTLGKLYPELGMVAQNDKLLAMGKGNIKNQELKLQGLLAEQKADEALNLSKKLYEQTKDVRYQFMMLNSYTMTNDIKNIKLILNEIEKHPGLDTTTVPIPGVNGRMENINGRAVLNHLRSVISVQVDGKLELARKQNKEALRLAPEFTAAQAVKAELDRY